MSVGYRSHWDQARAKARRRDEGGGGGSAVVNSFVLNTVPRTLSTTAHSSFKISSLLLVRPRRSTRQRRRAWIEQLGACPVRVTSSIISLMDAGFRGEIIKPRIILYKLQNYWSNSSTGLYQYNFWSYRSRVKLILEQGNMGAIETFLMVTVT